MVKVKFSALLAKALALAKVGGVLPSRVTLVKPVQDLKASFPMLVTELGMVTLVKPVQRQKAQDPMLVTELGMETLVKPVQP